MVTVLFIAVIATIGVVLIQQAVLSGREQANQLDRGRAAAAVDDMQREFEYMLSKDPDFYLTRTFPYERPRSCTPPTPPGTGYSPGGGRYLVSKWVSQAWPQGCGAEWTYPAQAQLNDAEGWTFDSNQAPVGESWSALTYLKRAEVTPPGQGEPLTLTLRATVGEQEVGRRIYYKKSSVTDWAVWSQETLVSTDLPGTFTGLAEATVYSGGSILLADDSVGASLLVAEEQVAWRGGIPGSSSKTVDSANPANLVKVRPSPLTAASLSSAAEEVRVDACGDSPQPGALCLEPGSKVGDVTVPANVSEFRLTTSGDAISVQYRDDSTPPLLYVESCTLLCSPRAVSTPGIVKNAHPGDDSAWTPLTTIAWKDVRTIASPVDVHVGSCPVWRVSQTACPSTFTGSQPTSLTIVAGSTATPARIVVGGPIGKDGDLIGLVSTSTIDIGYWAAPAGGTLPISAGLLALGTAGSGESIRALPGATPGTKMTETMAVTVTGSVAGHAFRPQPGITKFKVNPYPLFQVTSPPQMPGFTTGLVAGVVTELRPEDQAGCALTCSGVW